MEGEKTREAEEKQQQGCSSSSSSFHTFFSLCRWRIDYCRRMCISALHFYLSSVITVERGGR